MTAPYHSLHRKLENILKAYLSNKEDLGIHLYTFLEVVHLGEAIEEPFCGIRCQSSSSVTPEVQLALGSGGRVIACQLRIRSHAIPEYNGTDPSKVIQEYRDYHDSIVGKILDCLHTETLIADLNAFGVVEGGIAVEQIDQYEITDNPEDRSGVTDISIPFYCYPTL